MDLTLIIFGLNVLFGIIGTGALWWINTVWSQVKETQRELSIYKTEVAEKYVTVQALERAMQPFKESVKESFIRLEAGQVDLFREIHNKQDKA